MMTSTEIRQSFLDFFKSKPHTIVPSSSLMPDSPNLLFTNAGMNQFVPIFLGQNKPDVKRGPARPGKNTRAADTQKCIRAGGKHNDLDDVGLDTYHHTFFEMLGNWTFGDYFKREAIDWAWELVVNGWGFPADRLYATVFCPYLGEPGWEAKWQTELEQVLVLAMTSPDFIPPDPNASPFEIRPGSCDVLGEEIPDGRARSQGPHHPRQQEGQFLDDGRNRPVRSVLGIARGPHAGGRHPRCTRQPRRRPLHRDLESRLHPVQRESGRHFLPLPAKHVDTGMGFERVTSIIQGTKSFTDFANAKISNYETDIFRPIFDAIEKLSGKKYGSTLPKPGSTGDTEQEKADIAFRVIADHIRTL